jgi:DNA-directed RNA polymerase subunit RPC12/RpoP
MKNMKEYQFEEYRIKKTSHKRCPYCGSSNFFDTRARIGPGVPRKPGGKISEAKESIHKCKDCNKLFIFWG